MAALTSAKRSLRKEIKHIIKNISIEKRKEQSVIVFEKVSLRKVNKSIIFKPLQKPVEELRHLKQYQNSKRISLYLSTNDEIDTVPILKHIFEKGKEAFVPQYQGKTMEMVKLKSMEDYETLPLTKWNIKQPSTSESHENALATGGLDLIILPGVAFTMSGKRLGHGMGYYDKYLKRCFEKEKIRPYLVAVGFKEQIQEDIPVNEHDVPVDIVLTG